MDVDGGCGWWMRVRVVDVVQMVDGFSGFGFWLKARLFLDRMKRINSTEIKIFCES